MKTIARHQILLLLFALTLSSLCSAIELNPLFTSYMVIQRDRPIRIYGTGNAGESVNVTFHNKKTTTTVDSTGNWQAQLPAMPANSVGSKILITAQDDTIELSDVLIGDVWICSGQSNMGWALFQTIPLPDSYPNASNIRLLKSKTPVGSDDPQNKFTINPLFENSWQHATKKFADKFSAVSYYFGLTVSQELDVPIGMIEATLGGTGIQCWMPTETLQEHTDYDKIVAHFEQEYNWAKKNAKSQRVIDTYAMKEPGHLYNGMINPLIRFPIKGMIWYQGESNQKAPDMPLIYRTLFPAAINGWRKAWAQGNFPFFFVQLPGFYGKNEWTQTRSKSWPIIRQAQQEALVLPNTGMAVTLDCGHYTDIHPKVKHVVGKRLALHAIALEKKETIADGPIVDKIEKKGNTALITFRSVAKGLKTRTVKLARTAKDPAKDDNPFIIPAETLSGFEICGNDNVFHPATAKIIAPNRIKLQSEKVSEIIDIRYGFKAFPLCNLFNSKDLPARPFRTDVEK